MSILFPAILLYNLPNILLIAAAVIPAVVLMVYVYRMDRLEKEPAGLLAALIFWGILATAFALVAERAGTWLLHLLFDENSRVYRALLYFGVVALAEEGAKYFVMRRLTWRSPAFACQFDGVVYAVFVSLGFALWENISYVMMYGFQVAMIRAVTAIPGHACFGVFMGVWYGFAKRCDRQGRERESASFRRLAVLVPVLAHGCYDLIASAERESAWPFVFFIAALFAVAFVTVKKMSRADRWI